MNFKRLLSFILALAVVVGTIFCFSTLAFADNIHPNVDRYFYFCMEYTDFNGDEGSLYYCDDYSDKARVMNPVKVYEDGFYDQCGYFHSFTEICGNLVDIKDGVENYFNDNDEVFIDSVADAVDLILAYYNLNYQIVEEPTTDDSNYDYGALYLADYSMSGGFLESISCDLGEFSYMEMSFFAKNAMADNGMSYYSWKDETLSEGDVYRMVLDWEGYSAIMSYTSPACDELIAAIGDYCEQVTEKVSGIDEAEHLYSEALGGYFGESTDNLAENLSSALPGIREKVASAGTVSVSTYPKGTSYFVKGGKNAYISAAVIGNVGKLSYQWYRDGVKISGAASNKLYLEGEAAGLHKYKVEVTATVSTDNKDTKSAEASVTVYNKPEVSVSCGDFRTAVGKEFSVTASASCDNVNYPGNTLEYQWYTANSESYGLSKEIVGATESTLKLTPKDYGSQYYYLKVTDSGKNTAKSECFKVTFTPEFKEEGWDGSFSETDEPKLDIETLNYQIGTAAELAWYADYVNKEIKAEKSGIYKDVYGACLTADIDLNNYPWMPIGFGSDATPVNFTFDGCGHTVKNLYSTTSASGLFGAIGYVIDDGYQVRNKYCYIKNLTVEGLSRGSSNAGLIAGKATCTYFENVSVFGSSGCGDTSYAGGIVGNENGCSFKKCVNYADVFANSDVGYAGGISGYKSATWACTGGYIIKDNTKHLKTVITDCVNLGGVSGKVSGAMLGFVATYDNDFGKYDRYTYKDKDPDSFGFAYVKAVECSGNVTIGTASAFALCAKKDVPKVELASAVKEHACDEGMRTTDILKVAASADTSKACESVTVYINNKIDGSGSSDVVLAIYDSNGRLLCFKKAAEVFRSGHNMITFDNINTNCSGDYVVKVMNWDGIGSMLPLANTAELRIIKD